MIVINYYYILVPFRLIHILAINLFALLKTVFLTLFSKYGKTPNHKATFKALFLFHLFKLLGPTFIKIGQIISTRPDIFDAEIVQLFASFQNDLKPINSSVIKKSIKRYLKSSFGSVFSSFDPIPIGCGSIAQVHHCKLRSGRNVVVKIRKPYVRQWLKIDFAVINTLAFTAKYFLFFRKYPIRLIVKEFETNIIRQADFNFEASANRKFIENFRNTPIIIPKLYDDLCNDQLLVMEYFPDLKKINTLHLTKDESITYANNGLWAICKMMFIDGFVHADLHPGNVFLLDNGQILLLDFGLIAELKGKEWSDYNDFFLAMISNDGKLCAKIAIETAIHVIPNFNYELFEHDFVEMIDGFNGKSVANFEVTAFASALIKVQKKHGVKGATYFMSIILSIMVFEGFLKRLNPELNFQYTAEEVLISKMTSSASLIY